MKKVIGFIIIVLVLGLWGYFTYFFIQEYNQRGIDIKNNKKEIQILKNEIKILKNDNCL